MGGGGECDGFFSFLFSLRCKSAVLDRVTRRASGSVWGGSRPRLNADLAATSRIWLADAMISSACWTSGMRDCQMLLST